MLRAHLNRVLIALILVVLLPAIAVAERLRHAWGERMAIAGIRLVVRTCGIRITVQGAERIPAAGPWVIAANHSSPADIPALLLACPAVEFLASSELFDKPLLGSAMRALDCLPIDRRSSRTALRQLTELPVARPRATLALFPEGGIAPRGQRLPFKSGALSVVPKLGGPLIPVAIHGTDDVLPPFGRLLVRPGHITVHVLEPIHVGPTTDRHQVKAAAEAAVVDAWRALVAERSATVDPA